MLKGVLRNRVLRVLAAEAKASVNNFTGPTLQLRQFGCVCECGGSGFGHCKAEQSNDVVSMLYSKERGNKKYYIWRPARNVRHENPLQ